MGVMRPIVEAKKDFTRTHPEEEPALLLIDQATEDALSLAKADELGSTVVGRWTVHPLGVRGDERMLSTPVLWGASQLKFKAESEVTDDERAELKRQQAERSRHKK